jgi:dihydroxyacetone kinase-like predicted kinase
MIPIQRYKLEFILHTYNTTLQKVKNSLAEFGESLEIVDTRDSLEKGDNFKVHINTEDPTLIFDVCAQFGRIRSVKVSETKI